jgi:plasmid stabilization system protein ParE
MRYELTPDAEADLEQIAEYTLREWGPEQQAHYAELLEAGFARIAEGHTVSRRFLERYPHLYVTRCEHHYIFYIRQDSSVRPRIIAAVASGEADVAHWEEVRDTYRGHLEAMSLQVHPWRLTDSTPQSSPEVEAQLAAEVDALQERLESHGLAVKPKVLDKVRKQLAGLAAVVDVWWQRPLSSNGTKNWEVRR